MTYITSYKNQDWLLPPSIKQMIPEDHICFFVEEFIESLDFSGFDMIYDGVGHPAYHPRILMKILLQGMLSKERSSRKISSACMENFVFMYLAEKVHPNFRTICRFRRQNVKFIKETFRETIKLASSHNLIDLNLICTDGTILKANASKKRCIKRNQIEQLDSIIDKMIEEDINQDEIDKKLYSEEENLTKVDKKNFKGIVRDYQKNKNKKQLKKICERAKEELKKDEIMKQVSLTDPESRMVQNKKGTSELAYNAQFTVDSKNQIIVANDACQDRNDSNQLQPQIKQVKENIELKKDTKVAADCAYNKAENLKFLEDEKLYGLIPNQTQAQKLSEKEQKIKQDNYEYDWKKDEIILEGKRFRYFSTRKYRRGKVRVYRNKKGKEKIVPELFKFRLRMKEKMESKKGREIYNMRKWIVEPVIGNVKENLGFRQFCLRGIEGAKVELNIVSMVHNLKKIWLARGKISYREEVLNFSFILVNNSLECGTACKAECEANTNFSQIESNLNQNFPLIM